MCVKSLCLKIGVGMMLRVFCCGGNFQIGLDNSKYSAKNPANLFEYASHQLELLAVALN